MQDEITAAVTAAIGPAITEAEQRRATRKPPERLDAWEAHQRGMWHMGRSNTADNEKSKRFFQQAIALDRGFAAPYAALAIACVWEGAVYATRPMSDGTIVAEKWAREAVAIDPADANAQAILAFALFMAGKMSDAGDRHNLRKPIIRIWRWRSPRRGFVGLFTGQPAKGRGVWCGAASRSARSPQRGDQAKYRRYLLFRACLQRRYRRCTARHCQRPGLALDLSLASRSAWPGRTRGRSSVRPCGKLANCPRRCSIFTHATGHPG